MAIVWEQEGETFYATVHSPAGKVLYRLSVQRLDHGWDWTVWTPEAPVSSAQHGHATTIQEAMRAAERAAG